MEALRLNGAPDTPVRGCAQSSQCEPVALRRTMSERLPLYPFQFPLCPLVDHITCVQSRGRLKQKEPAFFLSDGSMLHAARHDDEFTLLHPFGRTILELHPKTSFDHEKQFVLMFMMMKDELPFDLVELYRLAVEFGRHVRLPVLGNLRELLCDVDFVHAFKILAESKGGKENVAPTQPAMREVERSGAARKARQQDCGKGRGYPQPQTRPAASY